MVCLISYRHTYHLMNIDRRITMNRRTKKKLQKRLGYKVYKNYRYAKIDHFVKEMMKRSDFNPERDVVYVKVTDNIKHLVKFCIFKNVKMKSVSVRNILEDASKYNISFRAFPSEDSPLADRLLSIYKDGSIAPKEVK